MSLHYDGARHFELMAIWSCYIISVMVRFSVASLHQHSKRDGERRPFCYAGWENPLVRTLRASETYGRGACSHPVVRERVPSRAGSAACVASIKRNLRHLQDAFAVQLTAKLKRITARKRFSVTRTSLCAANILLSPPENPLFSGFFHIPEIVHFVNLTSKSHQNDVKNDVKNDVRIPGENRRTIRVYRLP